MLETSYPNWIPSVIDLTTKSNALEFIPKFFQVLGPENLFSQEESLHHIYKCLYQCTEKGESCTLLTSLACTLGLPMHCLAAYYGELAPSTCTFANQLHCAVALLRLPNVLLSGLGGALLEAAHCTALAREQSVGVVWMQPLQCPQETPSGSSVTAGRGTAAAALQCSTMQCCPAHWQGCCSSAPAHAAASSAPAPTAAWGRHSVPNSWQASHGTPALRDWPMNTFQDFCSTNPYLSVKFSWLRESWWVEPDCTSMTYNHTRSWSFKLS